MKLIGGMDIDLADQYPFLLTKPSRTENVRKIE